MATLTVLMGLPASGKSTYAAKQRNVTVLTADTIRTDGERAIGAFQRVLHHLQNELNAGRDVLVDTCALTSRNRVAFLRIGLASGARCRLVAFRVYAERCRQRDRTRANPMPRAYDWGRAEQQLTAALASVRAEGWHHIELVK